MLRDLAWVAAAVAAFLVLGGCAISLAENAVPAHPQARKAQAAHVPAGPAGAAAQRAVATLGRALGEGDVGRLCRPGAVFTAAVVDQMNAGGQACEASLEQSPLLRHPPALAVTALGLERDLATARVRVGDGGTVPLDLVRADRGWLVSFSAGRNPLPVIAAMRQ